MKPVKQHMFPDSRYMGRSGSVLPLAAKPTPETQGGTKEGEGSKGAFRQLVGLKGAYTFSEQHLLIPLLFRLACTSPLHMWGASMFEGTIRSAVASTYPLLCCLLCSRLCSVCRNALPKHEPRNNV